MPYICKGGSHDANPEGSRPCDRLTGRGTTFTRSTSFAELVHATDFDLISVILARDSSQRAKPLKDENSRKMPASVGSLAVIRGDVVIGALR